MFQAQVAAWVFARISALVMNGWEPWEETQIVWPTLWIFSLFSSLVIAIFRGTPWVYFQLFYFPKMGVGLEGLGARYTLYASWAFQSVDSLASKLSKMRVADAALAESSCVWPLACLAYVGLPFLGFRGNDVRDLIPAEVGGRTDEMRTDAGRFQVWTSWSVYV